jgi:hypothetical protein
MKATKDDLVQVGEIGDVIADSLVIFCTGAKPF